MTSFAREIALALHGHWSGKSGTARCPAHDDTSPSLSITETADGKILVHCHAGCTQDAVLTALLGIGYDISPRHDELARGGPPEKLTPVAPPKANGGGPDFARMLGKKPSAFWDYLDADGNLLGYIVRIEPKEFRPVIPDDHGGWRIAGFPDPRPLYNLQGLAARPKAPVLVVEGEKTAVAASHLIEDHVCITWPGGAQATGKVDWTPLKGRDVTVWPDNDPPGVKAAQAVAQACLKARARRVRMVSPLDALPPKWDLADDPPAGFDPIRAVAKAKNILIDRAAKLPVRTAAAVNSTTYEPIRWAVPNLVPDGCTILAGSKSRGKSFIALDLALAVATGGPALGNIECEPGRVLYLALEDGERRIQARMRAILQGRTAPETLDIATEWKNVDEGGIDDIEAWAATYPDARLVLVDVLAKVKGRPDASRGVYDQDYATIGPFHELAKNYTLALILVHHTNKGAADDPVLRISGTMGLSGAADTTLVLSRQAREMHGTLDVRGRDVPEREIALQFDPDTGTVIQLGPAQDFRKSEERRVIIRALMDSQDPLTPLEVSEITGEPRSTVRRLLSKMYHASEVSKLPNGKYYLTTIMP